MKNLRSKLLAVILSVVLIVGGVGLPGGVYAAEAVVFTQKAVNYTLGEAVTFSIGESDYLNIGGSKKFGKVYKIKMAKQGILRFFIDEPVARCWYYYIYSVNDANTRLANVSGGKRVYNNNSGSYQATAETALDAGEYYVIAVVGNSDGSNVGIIKVSDPNKLTMSYIEPVVSVSALTLSSASLRMELGTQQTLTATVSPSNATNKNIIWKSEDNSVATVNNGVIKAVGYGTTKIVASSADGGASASCVVNVPKGEIPVSSVTLNVSSFSISVGQSRTVTATVNPANATQKGIVWTSSAPEVATVSNGTITAKSTGVAKITASSVDGVHKATVTVTVNGADRSKEIAVIKSAKPSISLVKAGKKSATIKFKKVKVSGMKYQIDYRKGNGKWKTVNVSSASKTIKKLTSKKSYSFRVRGYKKINGNVYYTKWSSTKKVKVK